MVDRGSNHELVPYPAYRWLWRETMAYRYKQDAHINELETQALVGHIRQGLKEPSVAKVKVMVIVDSQILFYAVGKGRSPSERLNRLLRRLAALSLAGGLYVFRAWTLSAWNFADNPKQKSLMASLRFIGLKPRTLQSYKAALSRYFDWLEQEDMSIPSKPSHLDESVAAFFGTFVAG